MESERDRPHFRTGELFICFTSSSSSMKLSKSILSPGRAGREGGPASLSCSVSRRLRSNGSLKGGASPFFTTGGKKRGCGFENPEPSSPKVTCIGQVRVKTKKKVKRSGSVSRRRAGEVSFRKAEQEAEKNQRWVHLPMSICEAVRAELSCLFPCKTSCFSSTKDDENGCWLKEERVSSRRHVFEDIEVKDDKIEVKGVGEEEAEGARVSICIPPKNALLLMRCRSDPVKMAALANRWDAQDDDEEEDNNVQQSVRGCEGEDENFEQEKEIPDPNLEVHKEAMSSEEMIEDKGEEEEELPWNEESGEEEEVESNMSSFEQLLVQEINEGFPDEGEECPVCHLPPSVEEDAESGSEPPPQPVLPEEEEEVVEEKDSSIMLPNERQVDENGERQKKVVLPECLLLMMCEPKLSMEVSKETWVCSGDFIRWKRRLSIDSKPPKMVAYELSRCKSEPMKTAAAKLMPLPESCFWKNAMRKLEPHRPGLGV